MKSWIETFSISMKLPIHANEAYIWDYLIHNSSSINDELQKSIEATPLREYADIGFSLLKWFIDNQTYLIEQDFKNFIGLLDSLLTLWCEDVKDAFDNLTFEDKNHIFKGLFRMGRNLQTFTETYPFFQPYKQKLEQFCSSLEIVRYDPYNIKKIKNDLNKVTHWSEAVAVSVKLPIKTNIMQLLDYFIEKTSEELESFLEGIATIDIDLYPHIGETLLNYYIFKSYQEPTKTFNGYQNLLATFTEFWFERIENIFYEVVNIEQEHLLAILEKFDERLEDLLAEEELPIFERCHNDLTELFKRLESIETEEEPSSNKFAET